MAIATSPCLHSVSVQCVSWDSAGEFDYNYEAMLEIVAGLAPNLKEVRMLDRIASPTRESIRRLALTGINAPTGAPSTLRMRLHRDDDKIERPKYTGVAVRFSKALEPLAELSVSGSLEP
ncbi:hypothetical protein N0V82_004499 [Gnomoniopsis sp. IMI 355080]|nr:hypothetical protein N0V82_004499 [Gnomoniopsis sp. IMI 355080]